MDKVLRAVGAVWAARAVWAEGVWAHRKLHKDLHNPNQGQKAVSNGGSGVDKALRAVGAVRAVGAEGVWAHIGSL